MRTSPPDLRDDNPSQPPRKSRLGCILLSVFTLLLIGLFAAVPLWLSPLLRDKGLLPEGLSLSTRSAPDLPNDLSSLRQHVADIQERLQKMPNPDELRPRLEGLHRQLIHQRDTIGSQARDRWDEAISRSEKMISQTRQNAENLPERLEELKTLVHLVDRLSKIAPSKSTSDPAPQKNPNQLSP